MAITDLDAQARGWALDEAARHCLSEDFGVDVCWSPQTAQGPQGTVLLPVWMLLVTMRSPLLGQPPLYHLVPAGAPVPDEAALRAEVAKGIAALRDLAAQLVAGTNGSPRNMPLGKAGAG